MAQNQSFLSRKIWSLTLALFILLILGVSLNSQAAKVLDIIIGGANSSICKDDSDCASGSFCHTSQHFCVSCTVPPFSWTGTNCECPAGTVQKDDTCVDCLTDTDCTGDENFCNSTTNTCHECHFPFEWVDNQCVCPFGTHESAETCVCENEHKEINETRHCVCALNDTSCTNTAFTGDNDCNCCPLDNPAWDGVQCRTCAEINPNFPVWDAAAKQCVACLTDADCKEPTPYCNATSHTCFSCPGGQIVLPGQTECTCPDTLPVWDGEKCVECVQNTDCQEPTPQCNTQTNRCEVCPVDKPTWTGTECVGCLTNEDCTNPDTPVCNVQNNVCEPCPNDKPLYDSKTKTCKALTCANLGFKYEGLRVVSAYRCATVGGTIAHGFSCGFSRKDAGPGSLGANGYVYVPKDGEYTFWGNEGQNKYGDVRYVRMYVDGALKYSASRGWPNGNFKMSLKKGLHKFRYEGEVYKRATIGLYYNNNPKLIMCNYGKGDPMCEKDSHVDPATGQCVCNDKKLIKNDKGACVQCISNSNCAEPNPYCNLKTNGCEPCPIDKPIYDSNTKTCKALTCANLGFEYEGLRVISAYRCATVGGTISHGFGCGFSRKDAGPGTVVATGYMYVPKDGNYSFWGNQGNNKYGDVRYVRMYVDGQLKYNAVHGNPNGNFKIWLKKGLHTFKYEGDVYKRVSIGLSYNNNPPIIMCNYGKGDPLCDKNSHIDLATGKCVCNGDKYTKNENGVCVNCAALSDHFVGSDGICHPCGSASSPHAQLAKTSYENCQKCSNAGLGLYWTGGSCQKCPKGSYCPSVNKKTACTGAVCCPSGSKEPKKGDGLCVSCSNGFVSWCNNNPFIRSRCRPACNAMNQ